MIAVDPHKASNTAAVLDPVTKTVIESARFANSADGYGQLASFAARWAQRRWAVEGCRGAGRSLAQRLVADGETVLDVPAKLAARVRVYSRGHGRKTDKDDAVSVGLAALDGTGVLLVARDDALVSLRLLCDRREELTAQRTQAVCRLHRLLAELTLGGMRRELSANKAQALLARIRPAGDVAAVRLQIARDHLTDIRALDARIKYLGIQIAALVTFASYNGTAPIDVSSGDQIRHRLSRAGNRRINHALHMMAVTQIRNRGSQGRAYYERKRLEGKTGKESLRCLKRRLSDLVYYQLIADRRGTIKKCGSPTTGRPTPPACTSPTSRHQPARPRPAPRPRPASTPSSRSTGAAASSPASRSSTPAPSCPPTSSTRPKSSAKAPPATHS